MEHAIDFEGNLALLRVSGKATPEDYARTTKALIATPGWKPDTNILIDFNELDLSGLTGPEIRILAQAIHPYREQLGRRLCACFSKDPAGFGLARMWEVYMKDQSDLRVAIFYTEEDARRWLTGGIDREE